MPALRCKSSIGVELAEQVLKMAVNNVNISAGNPTTSQEKNTEF